ncbi:hypothetical protein [Loigolactobacillus binensis]|uniref:Uncharacterized protein n=1 Tax=Loigolactobacillus binensis TaxID=2559922 RepID=A0ABW3EFV1_9LACO|nr:hypothetical protein [Loigolactobacillus binensis]
MNKLKALLLIKKEKLPINLQGRIIKENEVVILKKDGRYQVYLTNERAGIQGGPNNYATEIEALDKAISKARILRTLKGKSI